MPRGTLVGDPNLDLITINDFTPGTYTLRSNTFSTEAPPGSCSSSYRCLAYQGIGLSPLPYYTTLTSITKNVAQYGFIATGAMKSLGLKASGAISGAAAPFNELLVFSTVTNGLVPLVEYDIWTFETLTSTQSNPYTSTAASLGTNYAFPNMAVASFVTGGVPTRSVITIDPFQTGASSVKWITVPSTNGANPDQTGTFAPATTFAHSAYVLSHTSRVCFIPFGQDTYLSSSIGDAYTLYTSDIQAITNIIGPEFFYPEMGATIGVWGSMSAGELFLVYENGGGVLITGDPQFPTSAIKLPGITGSAPARGPAALTPIGLVYPDHDGAHVWNGGNTSDKISRQIESTVLYRTIPNGGAVGLGYPGNLCTTAHDNWHNWIFFANNWMFDCLTQSWWQYDNAINHQVFTQSLASPQFFYSSNGLDPPTTIGAPTNVGTDVTATIYQWDKSKLSSLYRWVSNPIGAPGSLTSLQAVEICASNPSATPCTITITPTAPSGQTPYPNQNSTQSISFTIPAHTASYRAFERLGWTDYNVCVQVDASNSNTSNPAPTLHEISCGIDRRSSANV